MKKNQLVALFFEGGVYVARIYYNAGYYKRVRFFGYSRRGVINALRRDYDCSVSHNFYNGGCECVY